MGTRPASGRPSTDSISGILFAVAGASVTARSLIRLTRTVEAGVPRRNPRPSRAFSLDYQHYARLVRKLRQVRDAWPKDETAEAELWDQIDIVWARLSLQDQQKLIQRFGRP